MPYWMALAHLAGIHTADKMKILIQCHTEGKQLSDFFNASDEIKLEHFSLDSKLLAAVNSCIPAIPNYAFMVENLQEQGFDMTAIWDREYPNQLKANLKCNAPILFYSRGDRTLFNKPTTAIVGSRKSGQASLDFTWKVAQKEVSQNKVIVSGYAKGVDRQALEAALEAEGQSIVVLPQGIMTFSSGYKTLYKYLVQGKLLIISYFHPKAGWDVGFAMARNEIIYGLAQDIFVAESDNKGGTWSGVQAGLQRQRKNAREISIFVRMPGETEKNANQELIACGAVPVDGEGNRMENKTLSGIEEIKQKAVELLTGRELKAEDIALRLQLDWSKEKLKSFLDSMKSEGVCKYRKGRNNVYAIINEPMLF